MLIKIATDVETPHAACKPKLDTNRKLVPGSIFVDPGKVPDFKQHVPLDEIRFQHNAGMANSQLLYMLTNWWLIRMILDVFVQSASAPVTVRFRSGALCLFSKNSMFSYE